MRSIVSEGGGNASPARELEGMEKPKRALKRKLDTAKAELEPPLGVTLEGRVSIARWNPKGMRRNTGP